MAKKSPDKSDKKRAPAKKPRKTKSRPAAPAPIGPRIYTDDMIIAAVKATAGTIYVAAERLGCHPDTIYDRAKVSKEVADAIKHAREKLLDTGEIALAAAVGQGDFRAIKFLLSTKGRDRGYVTRSEFDGNMTVTVVEDENWYRSPKTNQPAEGATPPAANPAKPRPA